jgi:8-oxo-dGTP pyrophosphatase MutT (NUDIX family)
VARRVLAAVEDLLFKSKISETADVLGVEARFPRSKGKLLEALHESPPDLLILDLNSMRFEPLKLLQTLESNDATKDVPTVGFLSHVQKDLALAARESGCDRVMARSAFTKDLPKILEGGEAGETVAEGGGKAEGWERLGGERLFETPYFALRSDRLRLPDGTIKDPYYIIERPDAAIIFPLTQKGEVVLVRQYRPPLERMELGLPAGLVERGEKPEAAGRRELLEETGYSGGEWEPLGALASSPSLKDNWAYLFLARSVEKAAAPDPDEHELVEVVKVSVGELRGLIQSGQILSSSGVAAIMLALERLEGS